MMLSAKNSERVSTIVDAAAQLFSRRGYHATSTREIARVADISENTLFRHFEHKEDIFWAALRSRLAGLKLRRDLLESIAECADPEIVLPQILTQLTDTAILKPELLRLLAVAFLELNWKAALIFREILSPIFLSVHNYLSINIEKGRLKRLDPSMVTTALAMTVAHPEFCRLIDGAAPSFSDSREASRAYTTFWLEMLLPSPFDSARSTTTPKADSL